MPAGAPWAAQLTFSGTIAIADADVPSMVMTLCWGAKCLANSAPPNASSYTAADASGLSEWLALDNAWCTLSPIETTLDRVGAGLYSINATNVPTSANPDPSSGDSPTITLTVTSGGAVVYQSSPTASCTQVPASGGCSFAYKHCAVQFT
jgi:hypothetical protein